MATNTIDLEIRARTDKLAAELAAAGKLTDKQATMFAKSIIKSSTEAEKASVKAAKETEKNWTNATKKVAAALGEGVIPKFEKLSGIGEALGGVMGASAFQVAALTAGVGALAAGAIALNTTISTTVANLDAEVAAVSDVQRAMSASAIDAIRPYAEAHKAAADAVAGVKFELAALTGTFDKTDAAFYTGAEFVLHFLRTGEGMDEWSRKTVDALNRAADAARKAPRFFPSGPESISADALYQVPAALAPSTGGGSSPRVERAKEEAAALSTVETDLDALHVELAQKLASEDAAANVARIESARDAARQRMEIAQEESAYRRKLEDEAAALAKQRAEEIAAAHQTTAANAAAFVGGLGSLISDLYNNAADNAEKGSARERKARRAAFATAKAAALVQAGINTALGVTQALTLPVPLNYINAAIVGALGAVEVGVIAAKQMPVAHTGRMIGSAPDEQPIMALRGEAVMSRAAVADMGGEQAVSERNRRIGGEPPTFMVAMTYEHRGYDAFVRRDLQRPTGVLRQATRTAGTAGLLTRG